MGTRLGIKCACRLEGVGTGVGMNFPHIYKETISKIKAGECGQLLAAFANSTDYVTVDAELAAYFCEKCGHISSEKRLDLYKPRDIEKAKKTVVGRWTVADSEQEQTVGDLGFFPYWVKPNPIFDKDDDFELIHKHEHACPECGSAMIEFNEDSHLKCPRCNKELVVTAVGNFD